MAGCVARSAPASERSRSSTGPTPRNRCRTCVGPWSNTTSMPTANRRKHFASGEPAHCSSPLADVTIADGRTQSSWSVGVTASLRDARPITRAPCFQFAFALRRFTTPRRPRAHRLGLRRSTVQRALAHVSATTTLIAAASRTSSTCSVTAWAAPTSPRPASGTTERPANRTWRSCPWSARSPPTRSSGGPGSPVRQGSCRIT
jgi:hypothetical protein